MSAPAATPSDADAVPPAAVSTDGSRDAEDGSGTPDRDALKAPGSAPAAGGRRWRWRWPDATPALLGYALVRFVGLLILVVFAWRAGPDPWWLLTGRFDSGWYQQIAVQGYDSAIPLQPDGSFRSSNLAFFPLLPLLIDVLTAVTPLSPAAAGLIVAWLASLAAAWGLYAVGRHLHSRAVGVLLAMLWGAVPHAVVQSMAYSEPLFVAFAAWSLYALLRREWLLAGALCLVAGLARPTASALIAAVGLTALVAIFRRQDGWRPWAAAALAPLGYLGYLTFVGLRLGRLDGYFYVQRESWGNTFDGGADTISAMNEVLTKPQLLAFYMVTLLIGIAIMLTVLLLLDRYPLPVLAFSVVSVAFVLGTAGAYYGKGRYLMPVFTLLLPVATALAAARRRTQVVVLTFLVLTSGWYAAYLTLDWRWSP
ncbi:glycosyltransferase family 39 protein [Plantactinospora mayteni]|uniref:Membrane protein n=1 Tax=Plantactinospora mayteni TaxID=566021 RepID=A0ABQ4EGQ4_9ACTN|nr:hypothetical protein [Plantactinospora mayteni]GIG93911.1 membrane protein [Plantactinospora mayteni]